MSCLGALRNSLVASVVNLNLIPRGRSVKSRPWLNASKRDKGLPGPFIRTSPGGKYRVPSCLQGSPGKTPTSREHRRVPDSGFPLPVISDDGEGGSDSRPIGFVLPRRSVAVQHTWCEPLVV